MLIRLRALAEYLRGNLFFVPAELLVVSFLLAAFTTWADTQILEAGTSLPAFFVTTVDGARALLGTVASATITVAGVSISISLLMIQLASSQFSPRVLYGFFRDPFTKWVTGIVIGTFTYCLLVLRVVRSAAGDGAVAVIPHLSVLVATLLGIVSIVAIVGLINHSARSMQVGEIIRRITDDGHEQIGRLAHERGAAMAEPGVAVTPEEPDGGPGLSIDSEGEGWAQLLDPDAILAAVPPATVVRLRAFIGGFVARGTELATVHPIPADPDGVSQAIRDAVRLGRSRTTQQDIGFVFRQLVDIALRALSPGINDPTTAQESLVHIGSLLRELLVRDLPPAVIRGPEGRRIERQSEPSHEDYVNLAFDQIRAVARPIPSVSITMLEVLGDLVAVLERVELPEREAPLRRQASLVIDEMEAGDALPEEKERVREAARARWLATFS